MLPLEGVTVVSLEQAIAVPFATRQLADLGARVIKVERPGAGDFARDYDTTVNGLSSHFVWCNRSKESIALDLKSEDGKTALHRLLEKADVFVQNLAPGALERMGFIPEELVEKHPKLIVCSLSGYGKGGPYEQKKAYDLLVQCEAGLVSITGTEETPSKAGISIADIAAGMYTYTGILTAIMNRSKTGKGTVMEVSMLEALGEWMGYPAYYAAYGGNEPKRAGASHSTIYPYGPFKCGDEKTVFIGLQNEREWKHFCEKVLKDPSLAVDFRFESNSKRSENRQELKQIIEAQFDSLTSDEVIERVESSKIANARLNTMKDFFDHPQLKARNRWEKIATPAGEIQALKPPVTMAGIEYVMAPVPALGEHTNEILKEIGMETSTLSR
ncbi:CaiB/BaiF CoA transferase family protein [Oceanobacillus saliphilus]|uniref:CaiB/BaiF CoA transferase family protein n=1 Tax=Oceanobacillus saliphilus TaxID=2925834 RepID=UPI00201DC54F|nr:CaiB/BaiF CoA-transferase family protein [Oceanobacillus saliphilus]